MTTLFDPATNQQILERIDKLAPTSKPLWGRMNVLQMLAHIDLSLQANFGQIELKKDIIASLFRGISRRILLGPKPLPKHLPAPKKTLAKEVTDFNNEKQRVKEKVKRYASEGVSVLSGKPHNILGTITAEQSAFISYKHIDHHLRQFRV